MVYGPGVKGNFARLLDLVRSGVPLPLAAVNNRRSFIGLDNLVDLLIRCVDHPKAAGQTLLVSDGQDLSTPELLRMIAKAMGRPARLFPVPVSLLRLAGRALGRLSEVDRLVGSLQVDSSATRELLGWTPLVSVEEGVADGAGVFGGAAGLTATTRQITVTVYLIPRRGIRHYVLTCHASSDADYAWGLDKPKAQSRN